MFVKAYFFFRRISEYLGYTFSRHVKRKIVVLTFDDYVNEENVEIPKYLKSKNIAATFFLTLKETSPGIIRQIVQMSHEIGGHSLTHSREERNKNYETASHCYVELKKYDANVASWRFPWTSKDKKSIENVRLAGFSVDSSIGTFYPVKKLTMLGSLHEMPWLRLPKQWQMDVNESTYETFKNYILSMVSSKNGIFVLGFHTYYQYDHFNEFKDLVEKLLKMNAEFMTVRESLEVLKNGTL